MLYICIYIYICVYTWKIARHILWETLASLRKTISVWHGSKQTPFLEMKRWSLVCLDSPHQAWQRTSYKPQGCCDMNSINMLTSQGHLNVCQEYIRYWRRGCWDLTKDFDVFSTLRRPDVSESSVHYHTALPLLEKNILNTTNIRRKNMHVFPHAWDGLH